MRNFFSVKFSEGGYDRELVRISERFILLEGEVEGVGKYFLHQRGEAEEVEKKSLEGVEMSTFLKGGR